MIRVLIADDHTMFREGLRRVLELDSGFEIVGEAKDGIEVVALALKLDSLPDGWQLTSETCLPHKPPRPDRV